MWAGARSGGFRPDIIGGSLFIDEDVTAIALGAGMLKSAILAAGVPITRKVTVTWCRGVQIGTRTLQLGTWIRLSTHSHPDERLLAKISAILQIEGHFLFALESFPDDSIQQDAAWFGAATTSDSLLASSRKTMRMLRWDLISELTVVHLVKLYNHATPTAEARYRLMPA